MNGLKEFHQGNQQAGCLLTGQWKHIDYADTSSVISLKLSITKSKVIFSRFALKKVLKRMGLNEDECIVTEDGLDALVDLFKDTSGIRNLEQAAEHIAANALYQIEVDHVKKVEFDGEMIRKLLA